MIHKLASVEYYKNYDEEYWEAVCTCGDYRTAATKKLVLLKMEDHEYFEEALGGKL